MMKIRDSDELVFCKSNKHFIFHMPDSDQKMRLQLFLSRCGVASRRKSAILIEQGEVQVNGDVVTQPYFKINPEIDKVEFKGRRIRLKKYEFYMMYKPAGILTSIGDDRGRNSIADLIPESFGKLFPVGRLDLDSEGLLILTNHGEAANRMLHPRYHFPKVYHVTLNRVVNPDDLKIMSKGIVIDGKKTIPANYEKLGVGDSKRVRVDIVEGRKRQIKNVFSEFDYKVVKLKRISIGPVKLGNLKSGEIRKLSVPEIMNLLEILGLADF
ncbi:MAG: pseudouridine synthase [bacterium]